MHQAIDVADLADLDVWEDRQAEWRPASPKERPEQLAPVLVLHLFGSWCAPCLAEFPVWRDMAPALETAHAGKLRVLYVALQTPRPAMEQMVRERRRALPALGPGSGWRSDTSERLSSGLRKAIPGGTGKLQLPVTLLLDDQRVVRQAFVGSIDRRRSELAESVERLVRLVSRSTPRRAR